MHILSDTLVGSGPALCGLSRTPYYLKTASEIRLLRHRCHSCETRMGVQNTDLVLENLASGMLRHRATEGHGELFAGPELGWNAPKNGVSSLLVLPCIPKSLSDSVLRAEPAHQRTGRLERAVAVREPLVRNTLVIRPKTHCVLFSVECALDE
jgi:hypothetical protein